MNAAQNSPISLSDLPADSGVLICGHGSRAKIAEQEFGLLAAGLRRQYPSVKIEYGFLEYSAPNLHMALDRLIEQGVKNIYAVPGMLFRATHAQNDIPSVLTTYAEKHKDLTITYGRELGLHDEMIAAFEMRILEALGLKETPKPGSLYDTMLVVVGRGTSVAAANAEAAKLCRIVTENLGFGWAETVYSGVTFPSVGVGLEMASKLGFKRVIVAPYFLFSGRLIDRIYGYVDKVAAEHPEIEYLKADYLKDNDHVINTFAYRIEELVNNTSGEKNLLIDFKERLARGEIDVHHHHAEFKPSHDHGHDHGHGHGHGHRHHHAPYRHIAHPLGPRTMIDENVCCCFMGQFPESVIEEERELRKRNGILATERTPLCKKS